jgi:Rieske Fe-S protein
MLSASEDAHASARSVPACRSRHSGCNLAAARASRAKRFGGVPSLACRRSRAEADRALATSAKQKGSIVERRVFFVQACQAASLAALGALLPGCSGSPSSPSSSAPALPTVSGAVSSGAVTVTVDASSPLATVGGAALVQSSSGSFLVSQTAQGTFVALTAICTHEACTVTGFQNSRYVCPCHGSQYTTTGAVVQGPAPRSLQQFATRFANNVLTITL